MLLKLEKFHIFKMPFVINAKFAEIQRESHILLFHKPCESQSF